MSPGVIDTTNVLTGSKVPPSTLRTIGDALNENISQRPRTRRHKGSPGCRVWIMREVYVLVTQRDAAGVAIRRRAHAPA